MILRRLIVLATIIAGLAVSCGVVIVGLIDSIFVILAPRLGAAGATAVLLGIVAVILGAAAAALLALSRPRKIVVKTAPSPVTSIVDAFAEVVRDRPVVVILAAVGAGILAIRNPLYLTSALRAFTAPKDAEN